MSLPDFTIIWKCFQVPVYNQLIQGISQLPKYDPNCLTIFFPKLYKPADSYYPQSLSRTIIIKNWTLNGTTADVTNWQYPANKCILFVLNSVFKYEFHSPTSANWRTHISLILLLSRKKKIRWYGNMNYIPIQWLELLKTGCLDETCTLPISCSPRVPDTLCGLVLKTPSSHFSDNRRPILHGFWKQYYLSHLSWMPTCCMLW